MQRLDRILSEAGVASRKELRAMIRAGRVTAIELDTTLRPVLAETVGEFDNLTIHFADAMKMDLPALVQAEFPGLTPAAYRRQTRLEQKNRSPEQDSRTRP